MFIMTSFSASGKNDTNKCVTTFFFHLIGFHAKKMNVDNVTDCLAVLFIFVSHSKPQDGAV